MKKPAGAGLRAIFWTNSDLGLISYLWPSLGDKSPWALRLIAKIADMAGHN